MLCHFRVILLIGIVSILSACGGGSGSSANKPIPTGGLTVTPSSLALEVVEYDTILPDTYLNYTNTNLYAKYTYYGHPDNIVVPYWMDMQFYAPNQIRVFIINSHLNPGTYSTIIRVTSTEANGVILDFKDIPLTYKVKPKLSSNIYSIYPRYVFGSDIKAADQLIQISGAGINWKAQVDQNWVKLNLTSGIAPSNMIVSFDTTGLAIGSYNANITVTNVDNPNDKITIFIALEVAKPVLLISNANVILGGADGKDLAVQTVKIGVNTGNNTYPLTLKLDSGAGLSWLTSDKQSGNIGLNALTINIDANRDGLLGNTYYGSVSLSVDINGIVITNAISVTLNVPEHRITVIDNGIAFVSTPTISKLTTSMKINDSDGLTTTPWTATSDQNWLKATSSGMTTENIVLTADPKGLVPGNVYLAKVTIKSTDTSVHIPEVIRVGLWVNNTDPNTTDTVASTYTEITADPIRPYVYANAGGDSIDIYNVYTAKLLKTISNVGVNLGDMKTSNDGSTLFVVDSSNLAVIPVNLDDYSVAAGWTSPTVVSGINITYARTNGVGLLYRSDGRVYDFASAKEYYIPVGGGAISTSLDGSVYCGVTSGTSPYDVFCSKLNYSVIGVNKLTATKLPASPFGTGSFGIDIALNQDGTRVYTAQSWPPSFIEYDTATMAVLQYLPANQFPNNIEVGVNGLLYGGINNNLYNPTDVWVYITAGVNLANYTFAGYNMKILDRQLVVSGDSVRIITATSDPYLIFVTGP